MHAHPKGKPMLITTRREGEAFLIGEEVEILIVRVGHSRVRVGIRAPQVCRVLPGEDCGAVGGVLESERQEIVTR
jgi:Global regulator protein family